MPRIFEPDYPHIVLKFQYRGCRIEIDRSELEQSGFDRIGLAQNGIDRFEENQRPSSLGPQERHWTYAAWVHYELGCAIAVAAAPTKTIAIRQAKHWIDGWLSGLAD